jgi:hypothetical protein
VPKLKPTIQYLIIPIRAENVGPRRHIRASSIRKRRALATWHRPASGPR